MDADTIAKLRSKAKQTGGNWIGLSEVGDYFAGRIAGRQTVTTDYGEAEELVIYDCTLNDEKQDGVLTFRLSRSVLQRELGAEAEQPPVDGSTVYVTYQGKRRGKSGREYHAYGIVTEAPEDPKAAAADAKAALEQAGQMADAGDDIPFAPSRV